jgi:hypothetical protein
MPHWRVIEQRWLARIARVPKVGEGSRDIGLESAEQNRMSISGSFDPAADILIF